MHSFTNYSQACLRHRNQHQFTASFPFYRMFPFDKTKETCVAFLGAILLDLGIIHPHIYFLWIRPSGRVPIIRESQGKSGKQRYLSEVLSYCDWYWYLSEVLLRLVSFLLERFDRHWSTLIFIDWDQSHNSISIDWHWALIQGVLLFMYQVYQQYMYISSIESSMCKCISSSSGNVNMQTQSGSTTHILYTVCI